jgi:hypothetical protein
MTLIYSTIGGKKIEKLFAFHVPDMYPFASLKYYRKWMVIMGIVAFFKINQFDRGKCGEKFHN